MGINGGSQESSQSAKGYGYSASMAESLNKSSSRVYAPQAGFLQDLWGRAQGVADDQAGAGMFARDTVNRMQPGMDASERNLMELANGGGPLSRFTDPNNDLAARQLADMSGQIGTNFRREVMPGIRSTAGAVGGMGGSREALARGVAAGDASRSIASAATDLYGQQYQTAAQASEALGGQRITAASALPGAQAANYQMSMSPYQAQWAPIASLAQAIGAPTLVNSSRTKSTAASQGENWNRSKGSGSGNQWGFSLF